MVCAAALEANCLGRMFGQIFDFFSVRSIFISPLVKILLLMFMSEIKNDLTLKKFYFTTRENTAFDVHE